MTGRERQVLIAGGGPAGLTAGYILARQGVGVVVADENPRDWGGISRTESYRGYRFDIGGHRFFSKSDVIESLWDEMLPEPMLERPRKSRIYYDGKFYSYPLRPFEALSNLGPIEALRCAASYTAARVRPVRDARSFEDWVVNAFGRRLFEIFFKTYTEKVWGMDCKAISADWAAQRIKGLSLGRAVLHALIPRSGADRSGAVKTLIGTFRYPRLGPGMMWEAAASSIAGAGGQTLQGTRVSELRWNAASAMWEVALLRDGRRHTVTATDIVSSIPMRELCRMLSPEVSTEAR